ncbi:MAG TPA: PrsW family glutamic-type intramembrane protease [Anaerolineae bacterium]|nr:PrsW family glutamic-type intramembrane protease [Anaerolineae bacterium]HQH37844.1 PrsW family glutamic-type intramembrane protease [Anaerolineae bacterium]
METKPSSPQWLWIVTAITGGGAIVVSLLSMLSVWVIPQVENNATTVILIAVGLVGLLLGMGLLATGLSGRKSSPSPKIYVQWGWAIGLALLVGLVIVAVLTPAEWHNRPIFAPLHLGLAALPAFLLLSLMTLTAGRDHTLTLRELIATMSGGAASTLMAIPVEVIGLVLCAVLVALVAFLLPGGRATIDALIAMAERWRTLPPTNIEEVFSTIASPVILVVMVLTLAIVAPLTEELGKTLVMGIMGIWRHPGLTTSFLWGAACGLGFTIVESITNGAGGLGEVTSWLGGMGARAAATGMHMLTSGIVGLGWGFFWRKRRWALPLAYLMAVLFHGLWNLAAIATMGGAAIGIATAPVGFIITAIGIGIMVILALCAPLVLIGTPVVLRSYESKPARSV